jgi:hypothetical protein
MLIENDQTASNSTCTRWPKAAAKLLDKYQSRPAPEFKPENLIGFCI